MSEDITWRHYRARVGSLSRDRADDDPELVEARQELAAIVLENRVRRALDAGPQLTAAQRSRVADLLLKPTSGRKLRNWTVAA